MDREDSERYLVDELFTPVSRALGGNGRYRVKGGIMEDIKFGDRG
jgi:hypothetical protein